MFLIIYSVAAVLYVNLILQTKTLRFFANVLELKQDTYIFTDCIVTRAGPSSVSYTHLDVYKRQL